MYGDWKPYVSVGERKANAYRYAVKVAKKQKRACQPIQIDGRAITKSFWGKAWCDHVESLSDYENRLPRGRTYVRNGSVVDLVITPGKVKAIVAGSDPYNITISIKKLNKKSWDSIKQDCSQSIDSLLDLLGGRLSDGVMKRLTDNKSGCFPAGNQINMDCDCPDWSDCCKHLAAVMYGIGSRLDAEPELLFLLRGVNQEELISQAVSRENLEQELQAESGDLAGEDLGAIFGIELDSAPKVETSKNSRSIKTPKSASRTKVTRSKKKTVKKSVSKIATTKTTKAKKKAAKKKPGKKKLSKNPATAKKKAKVKKKAGKNRVAASQKTVAGKKAAPALVGSRKKVKKKKASKKAKIKMQPKEPKMTRRKKSRAKSA